MKKIKRRLSFVDRYKANREIDRCRKMTKEELIAHLQARYADAK